MTILAPEYTRLVGPIIPSGSVSSLERIEDSVLKLRIRPFPGSDTESIPPDNTRELTPPNSVSRGDPTKLPQTPVPSMRVDPESTESPPEEI